MPGKKKRRTVDSARVMCCPEGESEWHQLMMMKKYAMDNGQEAKGRRGRNYASVRQKGG
jgi:hypothetical protein